MKLTADQVRHVGKLANLTLSDQEVEKFSDQLSETLKFVEELNEINTKEVEETNSVTGLFNITRQDQTEPSLSQDQALQNAKSKDGNSFKVKAVFENN